MINPRKRQRWQPQRAIRKRYTINPPDGFQIVSDYSWRPGILIKFALILVRKKASGERYDQICRYDTAHGFAHLDRLDSEGSVVEKVEVRGKKSYKEAYRYAKNDLQTNYQEYWQSYVKASSKKRSEG